MNEGIFHRVNIEWHEGINRVLQQLNEDWQFNRRTGYNMVCCLRVHITKSSVSNVLMTVASRMRFWSWQRSSYWPTGNWGKFWSVQSAGSAWHWGCILGVKWFVWSELCCIWTVTGNVLVGCIREWRTQNSLMHLKLYNASSPITLVFNGHANILCGWRNLQIYKV